MDWQFQTIGVVHSPCKEKFGVPRQSGLAPDLTAQIEILAPYDREEAFSELSEFSHIWVISVFHQARRESWQSTVRPPRLGGNQRVGVFASRAPYRPNPIGLSVFGYHGMQRQQGRLLLSISGVDLVDGTPVLDIKPYLPYADQPEDSTGGYTSRVMKPVLQVQFSDLARQQCEDILLHEGLDMPTLITQVIRLDPRPAYQAASVSRNYGVKLAEYNVQFVVEEDVARVTQLERC